MKDNWADPCHTISGSVNEYIYIFARQMRAVDHGESNGGKNTDIECA
jgi:hypothetical protein